MNERDIQLKLFYRFSSNWIVAVPNCQFYWTWESDILALTKSNYLIEYEIKISLSDYKRDFSKRKHWFLKNQIGQFPKSPNRFYYVVLDEINKIEVPEYAGLIVIKDRVVDKIKEAPLLHRRKISDKQKDRLYHLLYFRAWSNIISNSNLILG